MTVPTKIPTQKTSLGRELLYAARYYLVRPRALFALAAVAIAAGLALNWNWLVAAGLAPILLSTLPCLVMCAFGICMMCRSGDKETGPARRIAEAATADNAISNAPSVAASCCHGSTDEPRPETVAGRKPKPERTDSHA